MYSNRTMYILTIRFIRKFLSNYCGMGNRRICMISPADNSITVNSLGATEGIYAVTVMY